MKKQWARQANPLPRDPMRRRRGFTLATATWALAMSLGVAGPASALQTVTLNFDSISLDDPADIYVYSPAERMAIKGTLEAMFMSAPGDPMGGPFGIKFEIFDPAFPPPPFTTSIIKFNNGFMGGNAEKLDFRNTDDNDDVDVNALGLLRSYEGAPKAAGGTWTLPELTSSMSLITASSNLAAHELGHALGLRHHDSFGPIGTGIGVSGTKYAPAYLGPDNTTNASFHAMGLASTVALNADTLLSPTWFSERSAMKLLFNKIGVTVPEIATDHAAPAEAQPVPLAPMMVPNTQMGPPDPWAPDPLDLTPVTEFLGFAGAITGATLPEPFVVDLYRIDVPGGARVTIEAISKVIADTDPDRLPDPVDMTIELVDATLAPVPHPVASPFTINDDQFESTDSILLDVIIPAGGTYYIDVRASGKSGADITGEYELYVYGFMPFPKPFLAGDLNGDCYVGIEDLNIILGSWNLTVTAGELSVGDPSGDGFVGIADLNIVLGNWNAGDPPLDHAAIPEPATLVLLSVGGVLTIARRR